MREGYEHVLIDASCFILLEKTGAITLLEKVFEQKRIATTNIVAKEYEKILPEWIHIESVSNQHYLQFLQLEVDQGEASIIALAMEKDNNILVLDDLKARKLAKNLKLSYTGTLGILLKAKQKGVIPSLRSHLEKVQKTNFRFSQKIFDDILKQAGEL